jgi:hypothetical protein
MIIAETWCIINEDPKLILGSSPDERQRRICLIIERGTLVSANSYEYASVLEVPENVVTIGPRAFKGANCTTIKLPSTLEKIKEYAFDNAVMSRVDFSKCQKLTSIGNFAFYSRYVMGELPDSVETIGVAGVRGLLLAENKKLKLPRNLRYIGDTAFMIHHGDHIYGELKSFCAGSNMLNSLVLSVNSQFFGYEFTLHGMVDGVEVLSLPIITSRNKFYQIIFKDFLESSHGFDLENYDIGLKYVTDIDTRLDASMARMLSPYELSEYNKKNFKDYIGRHLVRLYGEADIDIERMQAFADADMITKGLATKILAIAQARKDTASVAFLLELIKTKFGTHAKSLKL